MSDANQRFSRLIAEVDEQGARFIVTKNNREVARIEPVIDEAHAAKEVKRRAARARLKVLMDAGWKSEDGWTYAGKRDELYDRSKD